MSSASMYCAKGSSNRELRTLTVGSRQLVEATPVKLAAILQFIHSILPNEHGRI